MKFLRWTSFKGLLLVIVASILSAAAVDARSRAARSDLAGCGGDQQAAYIGKPVDALRQQNLADVQFVCKEDCATTAEFRSSRLTVMYSKRNNLILSMYCG